MVDRHEPVRSPAETGLSWRAFTRAYDADRVGFLLATAATSGPVVRLAENLVLVSDPPLVDHILRRTNRDFRLAHNRRLEAVDAGRGDAALERWMAARQRATFALRPQHPAGGTDGVYGPELARVVDGWIAARRATTVVAELTRLNVAAMIRVVVGDDDPVLQELVLALVERLLPVVERGTRLAGSLAMLSRRHRRASAADRAARDRVAALCTPERGGVLGGLRSHGTDVATASNLAIALVLAGALVPAAGAAWTLALLGAHPQWQERARADPDVRARVLRESLRLYPPTWLLSRTVVRDGVHAGWALRAGDEVVVSPYLSHRRAEIFAEPERFDPGRWVSARPALHDYFPFGAGVRRCVAAELALRQIDELLREVTRDGVVLTAAVPAVRSPASTLTPDPLVVDFTVHTPPLAEENHAKHDR